MKLKDTGLTAEELKDIVKNIWQKPMQDMILSQNVQKVCISTMKKGVAYLDFYGGVAVNTPGNRNPRLSQQ